MGKGVKAWVAKRRKHKVQNNSITNMVRVYDRNKAAFGFITMRISQTIYLKHDDEFILLPHCTLEWKTKDNRVILLYNENSKPVTVIKK